MSGKKKKTLFRWFSHADYEEEEIFLREQHKKGYKFVKFVLPGFYIFEPCEPEDVIYQLDFSDAPSGDRPSYLQMFADSGWEYLLDVNGWSYFRKAAAADDGDLSIFSDTQSRIDMLERVLKRKMTPMVAIFLCCIIPQLLMNLSAIESGDAGTARMTILILFIILFILYLFIFAKFWSGLSRLKKKYKY